MCIVCLWDWFETDFEFYCPLGVYWGPAVLSPLLALMVLCVTVHNTTCVHACVYVPMEGRWNVCGQTLYSYISSDLMLRILYWAWWWEVNKTYIISGNIKHKLISFTCEDNCCCNPKIVIVSLHDFQNLENWLTRVTVNKNRAVLMSFVPLILLLTIWLILQTVSCKNQEQTLDNSTVSWYLDLWWQRLQLETWK